MKEVIIKSTNGGSTRVFVDGAEIERVTSIKIVREVGAPISVEIRGIVTDEVRVES